MSYLRQILIILLSIVLFFILFYLFKEIPWEIRVSLSLIIASILLWVFEPIPFSQTALILMILFILFGVSETEILLSGFSSPATFLIIAGLMLGQGVNETTIGKRIALWILYRFAGFKNGLLLGVIIIQQILSIFVPAPVIRTALIIPIIKDLLDHIGDNRELGKQLMMGVAYGGNISSISFLPAAVINVITIDFINTFTNVNISYLKWFIIMLPLWIGVIPLTWLVIIKFFPVSSKSTKSAAHLLGQKINDLDHFEKKEINSLLILAVVVLLWVTQNVHGIHPAFSALIGAILLGMPGIGSTSWGNIIKIQLDVMFVVGAMLSIGNALNESGTALFIASLMERPFILNIVSNYYLSVILIIIFVQIFRLFITNNGTAIVTLLPIMLSFSSLVGLNPVMVALLTNVTSLFGFIIVVGSLPNMLAQGTGIVHQKDFIRPGIFLTIATGIMTFIVVITWWDFII